MFVWCFPCLRSAKPCDMRREAADWRAVLAVHHFNVPALLDVLDRFIALHYTDWESLNGRNINNPPAQPSLASRYESNAQNQAD